MSIPRKLSKRAAAAAIVAAAAALASWGQGAKAPYEPAALAARVAELEAKVAYLSDRQQIHDVYLRYMRGFDRNDVELLKSAFWPDAQINYSFHSASVEEFVVEHETAHKKVQTHWGHLITNESVDIAGDVAHVETYVTELATQKEGKSRIVSGRYIDRLDRRNGKWRIAVREFIPHFFTETNDALDFNHNWPGTDCGKGTWDKRDPSYLRPLKRRTDKEVGPACAE